MATINPINRPIENPTPNSWSCADIPSLLATRVKAIALVVFSFIEELYLRIQSFFQKHFNLGETHEVIPIYIFSKDSEEAKAIATLISKRISATVPVCLNINSEYKKAKEIVSKLDPLNVLAHIKYSPDLVKQIHHAPDIKWTFFNKTFSERLKEQDQAALLRRADQLADILTPKTGLRVLYLKEIEACLIDGDGEGLFALI